MQQFHMGRWGAGEWGFPQAAWALWFLLHCVMLCNVLACVASLEHRQVM